MNEKLSLTPALPIEKKTKHLRAFMNLNLILFGCQNIYLTVIQGFCERVFIYNHIYIYLHYDTIKRNLVVRISNPSLLSPVKRNLFTRPRNSIELHRSSVHWLERLSNIRLIISKKNAHRQIFVTVFYQTFKSVLTNVMIQVYIRILFFNFQLKIEMSLQKLN